MALFCVILHEAILIRYRRVTDMQTDTRRQHIGYCASIVSRGKNTGHTSSFYGKHVNQ